MPTLKDIAAQTGYHVTTVSRVLTDKGDRVISPAARERILAVAQDLDYQPHFLARSLRRRRTFLIGVAGSLFGSETRAMQMRSLVGPFEKHGYGLLFQDSYNLFAAEKRAVRELVTKGVEGLILQSYAGEAELAEMLPANIPCLLLVERPVKAAPCVVMDYAAGAALAVRRLAEMGHRRIAWLRIGRVTGAQRYEGYCRAMEALGLRDDALAPEMTGERGFVRQYVIERADFFRSVTAILAPGDRWAGEAVGGLRCIGLRVPEDVSVVGYDDSEFAFAADPPLASIRHPHEEVGQTATAMMLALIEGRRPGHAVLAPQFVERASAGPCRRA